MYETRTTSPIADVKAEVVELCNLQRLVMQVAAEGLRLTVEGPKAAGEQQHGDNDQNKATIKSSLVNSLSEASWMVNKVRANNLTPPRWRSEQQRPLFGMPYRG